MESAGTAATRILREITEVTDDEIRAAVHDADYGYYSVPRECPCGEPHLSRWAYWHCRKAAV